jgi:hypothetical protein
MQRPRTPSNLSESLHQRLNAYALAASATGVGLLALAQPAEGKIIYTHAHIAIYNDYTLDLNHDGVGDFVFRIYSTNHGSGGYIAVRPYTSINLIWGTKPDASALKAGVKIRSNTKLQKSNSLMYAWNCFTTGCTYHGLWQKVQNRYLGLKFYAKGQAHYGWARLSESAPSRLTLTGYAYETVPNKPIITGKTRGPDVITLEAGSLGHLARGASGIPAWRTTNSAAATH